MAEGEYPVAVTYAVIPKPPKLHDGLVRQLATEIIRGEHKPGELLPAEPDLSRRHGVSRTVVREAIRVLASKGLVTVEHGRGTRVNGRDTWHSLDPVLIQLRDQAGLLAEILDELVEVRRIFEVEAAGLAAERATPSDLGDLGGAIADMRKSRTADAYMRADTQFHRVLAESTHNSLLRGLYPPIEELLRVGFRVNARSRDLELSIEHHKRIYDAVVQRDPTGARDAVTTLIAEFSRTMRIAIAQ